MTIQTRLGAALSMLALLFTFVSTALMPSAAEAKTVSRFYATQSIVDGVDSNAGTTAAPNPPAPTTPAPPIFN